MLRMIRNLVPCARSLRKYQRNRMLRVFYRGTVFDWWSGFPCLPSFCRFSPIFLFCMGQIVFGQQQDSQTFVITVPSEISIQAPTPNVNIVHSGADANQSFPPQQWLVLGNVARGVTVTFTLEGPFVTGLGNDNHLRRDAALTIQPTTTSGPASWTGAVSTISTDILNGKTLDSWQTISDNVGTATFELGMTFLNDLAGEGAGTFAAGVYQTTVTGEITENP